LNLPDIAWVSARQLIKTKARRECEEQQENTNQEPARAHRPRRRGAIVDDHTLSITTDWENVMAAYMIVHITITEEENYKHCRTAVVPLIAKFGGKI
jgi:hypothetical protein